MASLKSSLNLVDNMSKVLNRITGNSDKMTSSIERSQRQMNNRTNFAENLSKDGQKLELLGAKYVHQVRIVEELSKEYQKAIEVKGRYHEATQKIEGRLLSAQEKELRLAEAVEKAGKAFEQQHNAMNKNIHSSGGLTNKLKSLLKTYLSFRAVKGLMRSTIKEAGELTQRAGVIQAAFGDIDVGRNYFNKLQLYAIETRNDIEDLTNVTRNFMQLTKNTNKLIGLTNVANRLSMRTGSLGSAESLIQEAMRGKHARLQRSLHLTDKQVEPLKRAIEKGSLDGIISAFDKALNTAGLTDDIAKAYQDNPLQKYNKAIEKFKLGMAKAGEEALSRLEPVFDRVNNWLQSASADRFFGGIAAGITMVVEFSIWLTNIIIGAWDVIRPILIAIAMVYLVNMIQKLWSMIPLLLIQVKAWFALNWPILLAVGAVMLFIHILLRLGITTEQITGFVGAAFGALYAFIYNGIGALWNNFAMLAEFFINVWKHPIYSVKALFANLVTNVLDMGIAMTGSFDNIATNLANAFIKGANIAIGAINWIIRALNEIPGININEMGKFKETSSITGSMQKSKVDVNKWLGDTPDDYWKAPRMEYKDFGTAMSKGYEFGASLPGKFSTGLNSIENAINNFGKQEDAWNKMQNDTLGDLEKDVKKAGKKAQKSRDKSQEDLKWLRDLAEQEAINRFTTAEVKVELTNHNNINSEMDLDGVIDYMVEGTQEALQRVVEGVR